jgi:hypothetical protein
MGVKMTDANVAVTFSVSTSDFDSGIAAVREALASLSAPIADINSKYAALGATLTESHARALQAMQSGDTAAYAQALRSAQEAISGQVQAEQNGLREKLSAYADDARNHRITEDEKLQASRDVVEQSYEAEITLVDRKRALAQSSLSDRQRIDNQISELERSEQRQLTALTRQALDEQGQSYLRFGNVVAGAFNSQLRGLLSGTESWRDAFRNMLAELLIDFIASTDRMVVQWAVGEAARTAATATGTASRNSLQQAGAAASLTSQGAAIVRSILGSAAEAFAGVFGFLAPVMGPFAAGPAAAAQATVASAAGAVASADIGMWSVPADMLTLVHHNELIMPAAEAGAFRSLLSTSTSGADREGGNVSISPTTHFHVSAIDGGSVSQWMRSNSTEMLRAVSEAVWHGAHLGMKRAALR